METNQSFTGRRRYSRYICVPEVLLTVAMLTMFLTGCKGKRERVAVQNEEESGPRVAMAVKMGDAKATPQLLSGFYTLESGQWRWTAGKFSVMLRPPANGTRAGAILKLAFNAPDVLMQKVSPVTLTASINGAKVKSEEYKTSGTYTFSADVPAELLVGDAVKVDFVLDKTLPPGSADRRELGVIAMSAAFEAK